MFDIWNRRYTGSKYKLMPWIKQLIIEHCNERSTFFDVFGGTGVVTASLLDISKKIIINDFLFSNEIIYKAFFAQSVDNSDKLKNICSKLNSVDKATLSDNYVSINYGGKYFNYDDAKLIGYIREVIESEFLNGNISEQEYDILIASLIYSFDRCANTVGHYEAYIKRKDIMSTFRFELIRPIKTDTVIEIHREDANELAKRISADVAFIDPPYNSRQYSRFYHVLETITKWDKPVLKGVAMKPPEENMSDYCRSKAATVLKKLIDDLDVKYIVVTYNNTYDSKSSSSRNKISLEQIKAILDSKGHTQIFEKEYHRFNAGKTDVAEHKELLFITEVKNN
ncbi:DNA adenine methylase [Candidatus Pseudoruminococcus sp.]|uniref:DNA adenine methylase n=1 Tax=Candidatus Pseudoruminococcus sp. TaxID=3101048 RepID=UPI00399C41FF